MAGAASPRLDHAGDAGHHVVREVPQLLLPPAPAARTERGRIPQEKPHAPPTGGERPPPPAPPPRRWAAAAPPPPRPFCLRGPSRGPHTPSPPPPPPPPRRGGTGAGPGRRPPGAPPGGGPPPPPWRPRCCPASPAWS